VHAFWAAVSVRRPPISAVLSSTRIDKAGEDGAVASRVPRLPGGLEQLKARLEHTQAVSRQLIGLRLDDARELAAAPRCRLRVLRRDGPGSIVTSALDANRINVTVEDEVEDEVVVGVSTG
jgi:hypothetical protein